MRDAVRRVEAALGIACAGVLGAMLVDVFAQVIMRYVLRTPFTWGEELARFLQIWLTFLGASLGFIAGGHASIRMLLDRLPGKAQKAAQAVVTALVGAFFLVLLVKGIGLVRFVWSDESPALSVPFGIVYLALPVASGIILLSQARDLWDLFRRGGAQG